ncbi:hypothetical protein BY458DRAFT_465073 [Sporodiniella umbellata]|nr:hypothetical protein BY458DRAFT_465073 [Sporodiniella umbellata]
MLKSEPAQSSILVDMFQPFQMPSVFSHQESTDPIDGPHQPFQARCLGACRMELGSIVMPYCTFYELTESEMSEINSSKEEEMMDEPPTLPPKKRKRTKIIRYELMFSTEPASNQYSLDKQSLYLFPREAMTECLTQSAPHKILYSFYQENLETKDTLEGLDSNLGYRQAKHEVITIVISNIPQTLYCAMKQTVSSYELMCQNMMDLMKLHYEKATQYRVESSSLAENRNTTTKEYELQWSSAEEDWDKADIVEEKPSKKASSSKATNPVSSKTPNTIKKCLYCGCKTTPMWRRGPQGAGTLCNACGVKWKHGKILNDSPPENAEKKRKASMLGKKSKSKAQSEETIQMPWESTSSESSPLDSFSGSPNTSPSLVTSIVDQSNKRKQIPYVPKALSVYVGEDAIEAAAVLTLLKKTK